VDLGKKVSGERVCERERAIEKQRMRNTVCVREIVSGVERHIQTDSQTQTENECVRVCDRKQSV
jgi:hypothetical protein